MKEYIDALRKHITDNLPGFGDVDSVLALLYEAYSEVNRLDDARIKADFNALYRTMNGTTLQKMDRILDPVCARCREHEWGRGHSRCAVGIQQVRELENYSTICELMGLFECCRISTFVQYTPILDKIQSTAISPER